MSLGSIPRPRVAEGDHAELAVDTRRLYFFDLETGLALGGTRNDDARVAAASSADDRGDDERRPAPDE